MNQVGVELRYPEKMFKALANQDRIEMVKLIAREGRMTASDIRRMFYMEQPTCSHHLNYLKSQKIISSEKVGRFKYFTINNDGLDEIINFIKRMNK